MIAELHPETEKELKHEFEYYEQQQSDLGREFLLEVFAGIDRIERSPQAWRKIAPKRQRHLIHRFPFGLIYTIKNDRIVIIAVANLQRRKNYWKKSKAGQAFPSMTAGFQVMI